MSLKECLETTRRSSHSLELKAMLDRDFPKVVCNIFGGEKWIVDARDDWREQREEQIVGFLAEIGSIEDTSKKKVEFTNFY